MRLQFSGDPIIDLFDLSFEEADVLQGEVQYALNGQHQGFIKGEALLAHALELAGVVPGIREMMATEFVQMQGQIFDRQSGQLVQSGHLGQDEATGDPKDVGEGLETPVRTGLEEQEGGKVALLSGQVLNKWKRKRV